MKRKTQGAVTYSMDRGNEVSKMLITSLGNLIKLERQRQAVHTLEYRLLNESITVHVVAERYDDNNNYY